MTAFVDVFQNGFRDGTDGEVDCRYFSGVYFLLIFLTTFLFSLMDIYSWSTSLTVIFLVVVASVIFVIRPYKSNVHNQTDAIFFIYLATLVALYTDILTAFQLVAYDYFKVVFCITYVYVYVPFVCFVLLMAYKFLRKYFRFRNNERSEETRDDELDSVNSPLLISRDRHY